MTPETLRPAILAAIERKGLTISEVSRLADVDRANLSRYLSGLGELNTESADRLLAALGLTVRRGKPTKPA